MRIIKCDICKKVLDSEKDEYYTVGEISFHTPKSVGSKVLFKDAKGDEHGRTESWLDWHEIDLCVGCWDKTDFSKNLGVNFKNYEK